MKARTILDINNVGFNEESNFCSQPYYPTLYRLIDLISQVLRSSSRWSAGIDETESSIHSAVTAAISEAQHYIYIENQVGWAV